MLVKNSNLLSYLGVLLTASIFIVALFAGLSTALGAASSSVTSQVIVGNAAPTVTSVLLNHGNALTLTPNATTSFDINYTVTDNNGCLDVVRSTSTAFRNGVSGTCAIPSPTASNLNCYLFVTHTTSSCSNSVTFIATDTVQIYYFADSTGNASATFSSDQWGAYALAADQANATGSATSTAVNINVLTAINVTTSSINYGTLAASSTSAIQNATGTNAGNSSTSLQLYALSTLTSAPNSIATSSQQYSTASFAFGAGTALTASAVTVPGYTLTKPTSTTNVAQTTFWLLGVPAGTVTGTYSGTNVFSPLFQQ